MLRGFGLQISKYCPSLQHETSVPASKKADEVVVSQDKLHGGTAGAVALLSEASVYNFRIDILR